MRERFFRQTLGLDTELLRAAREKVPREKRDVLAPFV